MRQPVGVGVQRRIAQRAVLEHHRDGIRRARSLRGKQLRQRRRRAPEPAPSPRARCRSRPAGWCRARPPPGSAAPRAAAPASAATASSSRISRAPSAATVAASNRSLAYSSTPSMPAGAPSAPRRSISPSDRSNLALDVAIGCGLVAEPRQRQRRGVRRPRVSNASITWNSGCRDSERAGLSTSTSRSNGRSWCA